MKGKIFVMLLVTVFLAACGNNHHDEFQGYLEGKYTYLSTAVGGKLENLHVVRGTQVKAGDIIYTLDPEPEASQLQAAQQNLTQAEQILADIEKGQRDTIIRAIEAQRLQAQANLDYSQITYKRYTDLYAKHVIDKGTLDQATSNFNRDREKLKEVDSNLSEAKLGSRENLINAQEARVKAVQSDVAAAKWSISQKTVKSPKAGWVDDTIHQVGEFVVAGQPVISLLPYDELKVIFFVPEKQLKDIITGKTIEFNCDSCKHNYQATISFVSSTAEYTPPVIFSKDSRDKLVYRVEAHLDPATSIEFHAGQPVDVYLKKTINN